MFRKYLSLRMFIIFLVLMTGITSILGLVVIGSGNCYAACTCEGDFDCDEDVDGSDLAVFAADFGRTDCETGHPCEGDFDEDHDVDGSDLALFAADFGRTDCPVPAINFTHIPEYPNPLEEDLEGKVTCVKPEDYHVAVYIRVDGVWWTKPYYASPGTPVSQALTWTCDITTGGNDRYATDVAAFLLPYDETPVICGPCGVLPAYGSAAFIKEYIGPPLRTLSFAGYEWKVKKKNFPAGPGPNYFSDKEEDVWVDQEGLHLTISKRNTDWYCTEVILDASLGYGTYIFKTHGRVDIIDPMMVFGLFTWDTDTTQPYHSELDIEFTRWGNAGEYTNAQYVVQPCHQCPGCGDHCTRFRVDLTDEESDLTHYMVWQPGTVEFRTYYGRFTGNPPASALAHMWTHTSGSVPVPDKENIRLNFWLNGGNAPAGGQGDEVVITDFTWQSGLPW